MGEIADALKRARTRLNRDNLRDTAEPATPTVDGIARILHREREQERSNEPEIVEPRAAGRAPSHEPEGSGVPDPHRGPAELPENRLSRPDLAPRKSVDFSFAEANQGDPISTIVAVAPESPYAVRFRHLAIRVRSELVKRRRSSLLVTSAVSGEGKTTISVNLALALSSIALDSKIALVDLDLRRARIATALGCSTEVGFEETLTGRASLDESCIATNLKNLDLYAIREVDRTAHEALGGAAAKDVIEQLHSRYDYVIFDGPPVLPVPDVPLVEPNIGGCLLVVRSRVTRHAAVAEIIEILPRGSLIGVFLNDARTKRGGSAYGYYEQYASAEAKE